MDYKTAGVDIEAGDALVEKIKPFVKRTRTAGVLSDIGLFGGFFDARFPEYDHPVLVASTDGVGTKLNVAVMANKHDTVGQCLVNHCANDILACGAKPLFFLDYYATGKLNPDVASDVVKGMALACEQNACALLGGETAEMPDMYSDGDYDVAGTIIGVVEKSKILNGSEIQVGDTLIGLPATGLHTNGFSLARAALFPKYSVSSYIDNLGSTIGDALLAVHRSYVHVVHPLASEGLLSGISHITGGGIEGNTKRILRAGMQLEINWSSWSEPVIFDLIRKAGDVPESDMRKTFNLGIGMILVVNEKNVSTVLGRLDADHPVVVGRIVQAP